MNTTEAAEKWNCDKKDVAAWCRAGQIEGAEKPTVHWTLPDDAKRPIDRRLQKELIWRILEIKNGSTRFLDMTSWGLRDEDLGGYLHALTPLLLRVEPTGQKAVVSISDVSVTEAGFDLVGRKGQGIKIATPKVLIWAADTAGVFTASFIRHLVAGGAEDLIDSVAAVASRIN